MNTNEISCIMDDAPDGIKTVNVLLEWVDSYDGDMPALDPDDYDSDDDAMDAADDERRQQYWRLTGRVATSRAAWEAWLDRNEVERGSEYWADAEKIADRFRDEDDEYWPIDCHLSYERGDGYSDEYDTIEGAGHYSIFDL